MKRTGNSYGLAYYRRNRKAFMEGVRQYRWRLKLEIIAAYGGQCSCCGESEPRFLSVEHLNGDGALHRKAIGGSQRVYMWLKKNGFPPGIAILCMNCNCAKAWYGACPHVGEGGSTLKAVARLSVAVG